MKKFKPIIKKVEIDDTHYYWVKTNKKNDKGENIWDFYPSVTKILEAMPTPYNLRKWIGDVGNEKAEAKLESAAKRGSKIHEACETLLLTNKLGNKKETFQSLFPDKGDQDCIVGFINWFREYKPVIKHSKHIELIVASRFRFAGTLDIFCYIDDIPHIIDIKTSNYIHDSHKLQLAAYKYAFQEMTGISAKMGILHLKSSYKKGYSFYHEYNKRGNLDIKGQKVSIDDFITVYNMYVMLNRGIQEPPKKVVYPTKLLLIEDANNN